MQSLRLSATFGVIVLAFVTIATTRASGSVLAGQEFLDAYAIQADDIVDVTALAVGPGGELYVAGVFFGTVDLDPGLGVLEATAIGRSDGFLIKLDADGTFAWAKTAGSALDDSPFGLGLAVSTTGEVFSIGIFQSTLTVDDQTFTSNGNFDALLLKHSEDGQLVWANEWSSPGLVAAHDIDMDVDGNLILGGAFQATVDFDFGSTTADRTAAGLSDAWLAKYDEDGSLLWVESAGSPSWDECWNVATDAAGSAYCSGRFHGPIDLEPGLGETTLQGADDGFIWKLSGAGEFAWAGAFPGGASIVETIDVSPTGRVAAVGSFQGSVDTDPGPSMNTISAVDLPRNLFVVELDPESGSALLQKHVVALGTTGRFEARFLEDERLLVGSRITGTVDIDPGPADFTLVAQGQSDAMYLTMLPDGSIESAVAFGGPEDDLINDVIGRDGEILVAGRYGNSADLAPGPAQAQFSALGMSDGFVVATTDARFCPSPTTIDYQGFGPSSCRPGFIDVFDESELDVYHQDFGWDGATTQGVRLRFNPTSSVEVVSPCSVRFAGEAGAVDIAGARICGYGAAGVRINGNVSFTEGRGVRARELLLASDFGDAVLGANLDVSTTSATLEAHDLASLGQQTTVQTDSLALLSAGTSSASRATIQQSATVVADSLQLSAFHTTAVSFDATVTAETVDLATSSSDPMAVAAIRDGAKVAANNVAIESMSRIRLGFQADVAATVSTWMDAVLCILAGDAAVTAGQKGGSCFK